MKESVQHRRHESVLNKWARQYSSKLGDRFVRDGALDAYWDSRPRICLVLKECNKHGLPRRGKASCDLREFCRQALTDPSRPESFHRRYAAWAAAIRGFNGTYKDAQASDRVREVGQMVAVINLKKTAGAGSSDEFEIIEHAYQDRDLLRKQLDALDPDIVVASGRDSVRTSLLWLFELKPETTAKKFRNEPIEWARRHGRTFIFLPHLSARGRTAEEVYNRLRELRQEIPGVPKSR